MTAYLAMYGDGTRRPAIRNGRGLRPLARARPPFPASGWTRAIAAMREGMAKGVVHPRVVMAKVVPQLESLLAADAEAERLLRSRSRRCRPTGRRRIAGA